MKQDEAASFVEAYEESLIPKYLDTTMVINSQITHHFFDTRNSQKNGFSVEFARAVKLQSWLYEKSLQELPDDPVELAETFPAELVDWKWEMDASHWMGLANALKKERETARTQNSAPRDFGSPVAAMGTVLREMSGYTTGTPYDDNFFSLLRASPPFHNTVLMGIMAWKDSSQKGIIQQRITQFPSMWLYRAMHPGCCAAYQRISLLMHSITSYAALQHWPDATSIAIRDPFPEMKRLLVQGAKEHNFELEFKYPYYYLPFRDDNYMQLWRRKWAASSAVQQRICAVCWSADADWKCAEKKCPQQKSRHYYCSNECALHDWPRHYTIDGCGKEF
jgi:hypothetical protein